MALTAYYTLSRGGAIEIAVALAVLLALHPRRLEVLPTLALGAAGAALAIAAATQRGALEDNLQNATAARQGDEMLAVVLIVCAGVALLRVALGLAVRHGLWPRPRISREAAALLAGGLADGGTRARSGERRCPIGSPMPGTIQGSPSGSLRGRALLERLRQRPLSVLVLGARRRRDEPADRNRSGDVRCG